MLMPQAVKRHVVCWPPPSWQSGLASWSMFFLGVSCRDQPDRLTVIEDHHLISIKLVMLQRSQPAAALLQIKAKASS